MRKSLANTIKWYEDNADKYDKASNGLINKDLIKKFSDYLMKGDRILDAGCGPGRDSKVFYDLGFNVFGIDLSSNLLKIASEKCSNVTFKKANLLDLPFLDGYFDGIWASASLLHLETVDEMKKVLTEFNRVLKKGGILCILVKQQMDDNKTSVVTDSLSNSKRFFQWFSKTEINNLLKETDFSTFYLKDNCSDLAGRNEVKWIISFSKKN